MRKTDVLAELKRRGAVIRREGARDLAVLWEERDETGTHRIWADVDEMAATFNDPLDLAASLDEWEAQSARVKAPRKVRMR